MSDIQERVRRKLIEVAKDKRLVTYGELGKCVGTTAQGVIKYLDPINCEIESGNPLLTALAVSKGKGRPADDSPRSRGKYPTTPATTRQRQLKR